jgi:hypothetical protein
MISKQIRKAPPKARYILSKIIAIIKQNTPIKKIAIPTIAFINAFFFLVVAIFHLLHLPFLYCTYIIPHSRKFVNEFFMNFIIILFEVNRIYWFTYCRQSVNRIEIFKYENLLIFYSYFAAA